MRAIVAGSTPGPCAHVDISGLFTVAEIHRWMCACIPEMPTYAPSADARLVFEGLALKTLLFVTYSDGSARLSSDNPCTLAIIRTDLTRYATLCAINNKCNNRA